MLRILNPYLYPHVTPTFTDELLLDGWFRRPVQGPLTPYSDDNNSVADTHNDSRDDEQQQCQQRHVQLEENTILIVRS